MVDTTLAVIDDLEALVDRYEKTEDKPSSEEILDCMSRLFSGLEKGIWDTVADIRDITTDRDRNIKRVEILSVIMVTFRVTWRYFLDHKVVTAKQYCDEFEGRIKTLNPSVKEVLDWLGK